MIRLGRLKSREIGGHFLVSRAEVVGFSRMPAGRPKRRDDARVERLLASFQALPPKSKRDLLRRLREENPIHPLEAQLGATAEVILEAIHLAGPLTLRGVRGVMAESAFRVNVVERLSGWVTLPTPADPPYDFLLDDGEGQIKVQVKLQRSKAGRPMLASEGYRHLSPEMYLAETQRTRKGVSSQGEDTRPYRFGEFDILAVAMHPTTGDWQSFMYTVGQWLLPRSEDLHLLLKFQPVPRQANDDWTNDFETCVSWLREGKRRIIGGAMNRKGE
jgi:hypothetical protein